MVVINTSQFTTADYKGIWDGPGVVVLSSFNPLQSWTFAAIMDDSRDSGILAWMNIQLPGFEGVFSMSRPVFLECEAQKYQTVCNTGLMRSLLVSKSPATAALTVDNHCTHHRSRETWQLADAAALPVLLCG